MIAGFLSRLKKIHETAPAPVGKCWKIHTISNAFKFEHPDFGAFCVEAEELGGVGVFADQKPLSAQDIFSRMRELVPTTVGFTFNAWDIHIQPNGFFFVHSLDDGEKRFKLSEVFYSEKTLKAMNFCDLILKLKKEHDAVHLNTQTSEQEAVEEINHSKVLDLQEIRARKAG